MKNNVYLMKQPDDPDFYLRLLNSPEMDERRDAKRLRAKRVKMAFEIGKTVLTVIATVAVVSFFHSFM